MLSFSLNIGEKWLIYLEKQKYFQIKNNIRSSISLFNALFKKARKVFILIRRATGRLDLKLDKYRLYRFYIFQTDLINRSDNWKQFFIQRYITNHTNNCQTDCLQLQKRDPKMGKHSPKGVHESTKKARNSSYSICAFQSMKSVGDRIARIYSHNNLVCTAGDFH